MLNVPLKDTEDCVYLVLGMTDIFVGQRSMSKVIFTLSSLCDLNKPLKGQRSMYSAFLIIPLRIEKHVYARSTTCLIPLKQRGACLYLVSDLTDILERQRRMSTEFLEKRRNFNHLFLFVLSSLFTLNQTLLFIYEKNLKTI